MNTDKASKLLRKIQALYENLSDQGTMSSLERDLLLSYLRDLYEEFSAVPAGAGHQTVIEDSSPGVEMPTEPAAVARPEKQWTPPPVVMKPPVAPREEAPRPVETPVPPPKPQMEVPPPPETDPVPSTPPMTTIEPSVIQNTTEPALEPEPQKDGTLESLFEFRAIGDLAEKLKLQPLDRVEHGMGINERILIINELFHGDGILFNRTLEELNAMQSFEEARNYLITGVAGRFQWDEDAKRDQATHFIQQVRRRFLRGV